jgi:site-specific recombinase XerD
MRYLTEWLAGITERNAKGTHERYSNAVKLFIAHLNDKAQRSITAITPRDMELFLTSRLRTGVASKTAILDMKVLNSAFRRAETYGVILKNPVKPVQLPKAESSDREVFTNEQIQKLLNAAPSVDWQILILLNYFIGGRLGDCVHLTWENINAVEGTVVYHQKKTGRKVVVPMHYHVIEHLKFLSTFGTNVFLYPKLAGKGSGGKHGLAKQQIFCKLIIHLSGSGGISSSC